MWILFGTIYDAIDGESVVYFIGVFDDFSVATIQKNKFETEDVVNGNGYFIKEVKMNCIYNYEWNSDL
jgi:hypothetical protein